VAAAALQRAGAFSLDIYQPGRQRITAAVLIAELGVPPVEEDYGRPTLQALSILLAGADPLPPDYAGAWEDVAEHVLTDLRQDWATHAA
jgi:hypothetical protein